MSLRLAVSFSLEKYLAYEGCVAVSIILRCQCSIEACLKISSMYHSLTQVTFMTILDSYCDQCCTQIAKLERQAYSLLVVRRMYIRVQASA